MPHKSQLRLQGWLRDGGLSVVLGPNLYKKRPGHIVEEVNTHLAALGRVFNEHHEVDAAQNSLRHLFNKFSTPLVSSIVAGV